MSNLSATADQLPPCKSPSSRSFFGLGFYGFDQDFPDANYYIFVQNAILASLVAAVIFWVASLIADLVRFYFAKKPIDWEEIVINAMSRALYSFISTILLFLIIT